MERERDTFLPCETKTATQLVFACSVEWASDHRIASHRTVFSSQNKRQAASRAAPDICHHPSNIHNKPTTVEYCRPTDWGMITQAATMIPSILSKAEGKRRPRQSVSFPENEAEVVLEVESCFDYPEDVRLALWHSRSDYHFSKSSARVVAKEAERYGHSRHLDGVYISSYNQQVQDSLNLWCLHGHSRRGLERWCNGPHGQARKKDSYIYIHGVLRAQAEMKLKEEFCHERLREVGHVLSRKSRLFAQMLGEGDRESAKWEFGLVDATVSAAAAARTSISPVQPQKKNLGLSGRVAAPAAARSSISRSTAPARRSSATRAVAPKITIRTKPGRVPRMA